MKRLITGLSAAFLIVLASGCGTTKSADVSIEMLTSMQWELKTINGKDAVATDYASGLPVANFSTDHKVSGKSGCNSYSGSYNLNDEGGINMSEFITTKMFCEGQGEANYLKALNSANVAKVEKDKLVLYNGVDEILVFTPKN